MTPEQIVRIEPKMVWSKIDKETDYQLSPQQRRALFRLLAIKEQMRNNPNFSNKDRENAITNFLDSEGLHDNKSRLSEVDSLIVKTTTDMMIEKLKMKDLQNRLNKLNGIPIEPDTEEEALFRRSQKLGGKNTRGKKTRKHTKRNKKHIDKKA